MVTSTNLSIYADSVRLYIGDSESPYTFSDSTILQALVESVRYLSPRWDRKYLIYSSGILVSDNGVTKLVNTPDGQCTISSSVSENDVFRNCYKTFVSIAPPIIDAQDEAAIILAAAYLMRRASLTSTNIGQSWSTPDLSFSNIETSRTLRSLMQTDLDALNLLFKQKLGRIQIGSFYPRSEIQFRTAVEVANYYVTMVNS
jgi:hypothetical protein